MKRISRDAMFPALRRGALLFAAGAWTFGGLLGCGGDARASRAAAEICADSGTPATELAAAPSPQAVAVVGDTVFVTLYVTSETANSFQVAQVVGGALDVV